MNKLVVGKTDLATTHPLLAKEWHPTKNGKLSPEQVTGGCGKKVWWVCEKGHEWQATVNHRGYGRGCPVCSGNQVLVGYTDLQFNAEHISSFISKAPSFWITRLLESHFVANSLTAKYKVASS